MYCNIRYIYELCLWINYWRLVHDYLGLYIVGSFFMAIYILLYLPVAWCCLGTRSSASTGVVWSGHVVWRLLLEGLIWKVVVCDLCESNTVLKSVGSSYYINYPNYILSYTETHRQYFIDIDSGNVLAPNMQQAINTINDDFVSLQYLVN